MSSVTEDPKAILNDAWLSDIATRFDRHLAGVDANAPELAAFSKAWNALSDEQSLQLISVLGNSILAGAMQGQLLSRRDARGAWEATGFFVDGDTKAVNAKVGNAPYQPVGFDDGVHYLPLRGAGMLWRREWGMSVVFPFTAPFEITDAPAQDEAVAQFGTRLSERERGMLGGWCTLLTQDREAWMSDSLDAAARKEKEFQIRESVKLIRIQLPRVDKMMTDMEQRYPEVGQNFSAVEVLALLDSVLDYAMLKLDDDHLQQVIDGKIVVDGDGSAARRKSLGLMKSRLEALGDGSDGPATLRCLDEAAVVFPPVREALDALRKADAGTTAAQGLNAVLEWTRAELAKPE
jgi:hypothetical protein